MTLVKYVNGEEIALSEAEIAERQAQEAEWEAGETARQLEAKKAQKRLAYETEADPLFFKSERGEISKQAWLDKCAEIEARFV